MKFLLFLATATLSFAEPEFSDVFVPGKDGYPALRIPSVVVTKKGSVLAFAEARKTLGDQSENDIVTKRSTDGGATWSALKLIHDDGANSLNNPTAVVDQNTGRVFVMYQRIPAHLHETSKETATGLEGPNIYRNFLVWSDDDGVTWSKPLDVTATTKRPERATTICSGPGVGIQLTRGPHKGRLIIPFNEGPFWQWQNFAVFSDDAGKTWSYGKDAPGALLPDAKMKTRSQVNEIQMVELNAGGVRIDSRQFAGARVRKTATSADGGVTWSIVSDIADIRDPSCMAGVLRYSFDDGKGLGKIIHTGPDSNKRDHGTVYLSLDDGATFPIKRELYAGGFAYSVPTRLADGRVGVLFEADGYKRIAFARFGIDWLTSDVNHLTVPAFTAYTDPKSDALRVSKEHGITGWSDATQHVLWFGELKAAGALAATVAVKAKDGVKLALAVNGETHEATVKGGIVDFGSYTIAHAGYAKFDLSRVGGEVEAVEALVLGGAAAAGAHFNLDPRRNAASVHLMYPTPKDAEIAMFYNEVTAVEDPVATYYMACGFSRGYFGMQVNSATERRIIFSVWDAGNGENAKDRSNVKADDQTQLLGKGEGVEASVFGNEGTGGHSHLVYNWKTGEAQKFVATAKADGTHTTYSGYWFHPEKKAWMLIASFRAPKDGKLLRGLYSFSENFGGSNGHLQRKALFGPQWIADTKGQWTELLEAKFSHDPTGKANRLDRFMGVESGKFFLSQGGFMEGFTKYGEPFTRASTKSPAIQLPTP